MSRSFFVAALACLWACGAAQGDGREHRDTAGAIESWVVAGNAEPVASDGSRTARTGDRSARRQGTHVEGSHQSTAHVIDVRFDDADLVNALRFLADEAGLSLVIGEGVDGRVNDTLSNVDAYRAMVAIARAHGASIERQDNVVIVRGE